MKALTTLLGNIKGSGMASLACISKWFRWNESNWTDIEESIYLLNSR